MIQMNETVCIEEVLFHKAKNASTILSHKICIIFHASMLLCSPPEVE